MNDLTTTEENAQPLLVNTFSTDHINPNVSASLNDSNRSVSIHIGGLDVSDAPELVRQALVDALDVWNERFPA